MDFYMEHMELFKSLPEELLKIDIDLNCSQYTCAQSKRSGWLTRVVQNETKKEVCPPRWLILHVYSPKYEK